MGMLKVNPQAEASTQFPTFQPGTYRMRVKEVRDREENPQEGKEPKPDYMVSLEYVDPSQLVLLDGTPYNGSLDATGTLFDYVMKDPEKQWKLRQITEAAGLPWEDYDPCVGLLGKELDVKVKTEVYEGEQRNKVSRYIIPKK